MVVVHHLCYPRLLVFCGSVVVPTVAPPARIAFLPIYAAGHSLIFCDALLFIPRLYAYRISYNIKRLGESALPTSS